MLLHLPSSSLWIHHPQVSIPGAIVSHGNLRIGGKMKDVTSFKRIFADVYYGSGQNTSVGKGNGSQTSPLASQSGELAMPLKILNYLMAQIRKSQHGDWALWAEARRECGGLPEQRGGQDWRQDPPWGEPHTQVRSYSAYMVHGTLYLLAYSPV